MTFLVITISPRRAEVVRHGWKLSKRIQAPHPREVLSPVVGVVTPAESLQERLQHDTAAASSLNDESTNPLFPERIKRKLDNL